MDRSQVLQCLNNNEVTVEFITDWATRRAQGKLASEQLSWVINRVIQQAQFGMLSPEVISDMTLYHEINELRDMNGNHIKWF